MKHLVQYYSSCEGIWCPYWIAQSLPKCQRRAEACKNEFINRGRKVVHTRIIVWYETNKLFHDAKEIVNYVCPDTRQVHVRGGGLP